MLLLLSPAFASDAPIWSEADPDLWFIQLAGAEAEFGRLLPAWKQERAELRELGDGDAARPLRTEIARLRSALLVERNKRAAIAAVLADADVAWKSQETGTVERRALVEQLEAELPASTARAAGSYAAAMLGLHGARKPSAALTAWWDAREDGKGLTPDGSPADVPTRLAEALNLVAGDEPAVHAAFDAANDEDAFRRRLMRARRDAEQAVALRGAAEARVRDLEGQERATMLGVNTMVETLREREAELARVEAQLGARGERSSTYDDLGRLGGAYAGLGLGLERVPGRVGADALCQVLVHGGMSRLMAGQDGAQDMLRQAASAWGGSCHATVAPLLDDPLFQAAWAQALFLESAQPAIDLVVAWGHGRWIIDGVEVAAVGSSTVKVRAGLHRFEFADEDGQRAYLVEELGLRDRVSIEAGPHGIALTNLDARDTTFDPASLPTPEREHGHVHGGDDGPNLMVATESARDGVHLAVPALWVRADGRDHFGLSVQAYAPVVRSKYVRLELGLAQDVAWGQETYRYTGSFAAPVLLRERGSVALRTTPGRLQAGLAFEAGLVPPLNAFTLGGAADLSVRLTPSLWLVGAAGVAWTAWGSDLAQAVPEPTLSVGLGHWL